MTPIDTPCDPPLDCTREALIEFIHSLRPGDRVIERGVSGMQGQTGTVVITPRGTGVEWDTKFQEGPGKMTTSVTGGTRRLPPEPTPCHTCGSGDRVPREHWVCPECDAEWPPCEEVKPAAMFGVETWNPLAHGIRGVPLMVPASEYNRVATNLADALALALQYVPLKGEDASKIRRLEMAATIPPTPQPDAALRPQTT